MATKINPDFYGAENTFVSLYTDLVKTSQYTIANLITNGTYTGGDLDHTATPWGVGKSSISSDFQSQLTKGATWTIFENKNQRKNTPLWFYYTPSPVDGADNPADIVGTGLTSTTYARALYKNRYDPSVTIDGNNIKSSLTVDNNANVQLINTNTLKPITFLNYSGIRVCLRYVYYKTRGEGDFKRTSFVNFYNNSVNANRVFGFDFTIRDKAANILPIYVSIGGSALDIPDVYKQSYYGESHDKWVRPWRSINSVGYWNMISLSWATFNTDTGCIYSSVFDTLNSDDNAVASMGSCGWGHLSDTPQIFDDISYHWTYGYSPITAEEWVQNPIHTGDTYTSGVYRSFAQLDLDDGATINNDNLAKAIMHEIAFLGLPFCFGSGYANAEIGSSDIYLPVFDEHLVTTGEYVNGSASLDLPNASWTDVFGVNMPDYNPDYDPDAPPEPGEDFGDLSNEGHMQYRFDTRLNIWCFYNGGQYAGIDTVLNAINNLYLTDPDGNSKWQLDFKGSNPSDYIVGLYATPLIVPHSSGLTTFTLGPVDFDGDIETYTYNGSGHFTFGSVNLYGDDYPLFNDFRDFAPYTQIELYIPLCGTVTIDPAFFVGHSMTVDMYYDILTMSCVAAIYRDGITLYKTVNGSIGAEIPITSLDMGSYQNTIHSLESAQKQNDMRLMTSVLTMGASAAAAIATGGVSLGVGAAALAGGAGLLQTAEQGQQIDYNIDHTAPTVAQTGTAEAQNSFCVGSMYAKLFVKRAKLLSGHNDTVYSKTVGNACCINDYIGGTEDNPRAGLVVCSNINTNDIVNDYGESPTAEEINAIKQAFSTGVYI